MSLSAFRVSVQSTPTRLYPFDGYLAGTTSALLKNMGTADIAIGGADVTLAQGYPLPAGDQIGVDLATTEAVYAIAATGTTVQVAVLGGAR